MIRLDDFILIVYYCWILHINIAIFLIFILVILQKLRWVLSFVFYRCWPMIDCCQFQQTPTLTCNLSTSTPGENTIFGNQLINKSYFLCLRWTGTDSPRSEWYISPDRINQAAEFAKSWLGGKQATLMIGWCTSVHNNDNHWKLFLNISEIFIIYFVNLANSIFSWLVERG